jgi:hypothetical protein
MSDPSKPLKNTRYEVFCQRIIAGSTNVDAHEAAGYERNDGNAASLRHKPIVAARIEWLQGRSAEKVTLTKAFATDKLLHYAEKAEGMGNAAGISVARQAIMDAATLNGMVVNRSESGKAGEFDELSNDERDSLTRALAQALREKAKGNPSRAPEERSGTQDPPLQALPETDGLLQGRERLQ